jgi:hypothetical protein
LDTEELEAVSLLHCCPVDVDGDVLAHDQLLGLTDDEEEVVALAPHCQINPSL